MAVITDHVNVQAILQTAVGTRTTFGLQMILLDDDQIPVDQRYRIMSQSDYTDLDAGVLLDYATTYFAQKRTPQQLMIGRWAKVATSPYFYCGDEETDYLIWKAVTDGTFTVDDGTNTDDLTAVDFSGITAIGQVPTILTAKIQAIAVPNITGLDTSEFVYDSIGRLVLVMSTTGAAAATIEIVSEGTGTDLTLAAFMDVADGAAVAGLDAEEPTEAVTAIREKNDTFYNSHIRSGPTDDQQVALAAQYEGLEKLLDLTITDTGALTTAESSSVPYRINALSYKRTMCIFTKQTTEYPDAADSGAVLPADEGTTSFAYEVLAGVTDSGGSTPLTTTEKAELKSKNCTWIETVGDSTYLYDGITSGGEEKRIMLGRDWFVARIREAIFADLLNSPVHNFDNPTLTKTEGFIRDVGEEAIARGILVDTAERPWTVTIPDADDFTAAERASHTMSIADAFLGYLNSAVNDYTIVGTWSI